MSDKNKFLFMVIVFFAFVAGLELGWRVWEWGIVVGFITLLNVIIFVRNFRINQ
jgi:hypothetical protein